MGNLCSKSANQPDNFSSPGRTLGSGPPSKPTSASVPPKLTASSPGRALGGSDAAPSSTNPRSAAAKAAEDRASRASKTGGQLSTKLASQKKQTQSQVLNSGSEAERRARDADQNADLRSWN